MLCKTGIESMALCYTRLRYWAQAQKSIRLETNHGKFNLYINDKLIGKNLSESELENFIIDFK